MKRPIAEDNIIKNIPVMYTGRDCLFFAVSEVALISVLITVYPFQTQNTAKSHFKIATMRSVPSKHSVCVLFSCTKRKER